MLHIIDPINVRGVLKRGNDKKVGWAGGFAHQYVWQMVGKR